MAISNIDGSIDRTVLKSQDHVSFSLSVSSASYFDFIHGNLALSTGYIPEIMFPFVFHSIFVTFLSYWQEHSNFIFRFQEVLQWCNTQLYHFYTGKKFPYS